MAEEQLRDPWICASCGGPRTGCMVGLQGDSEWECLDCGLQERVFATPRPDAGRRRQSGPRFIIERPHSSERDISHERDSGPERDISHADESS
jgi:rubredoxin